MNTNHTPGPWIRHGLAVYTPEHWQHGDDIGSKPILQVNDGDEGDEAAGDIAAANACLAAAAPELLETLKGCAAVLMEAGKDFALANPRAARPNLYELHAEAAVKAIKKAQGIL